MTRPRKAIAFDDWLLWVTLRLRYARLRISRRPPAGGFGARGHVLGSGTWDWNRSDTALSFLEINGRLVTFGKRRLHAALLADTVPDLVPIRLFDGSAFTRRPRQVLVTGVRRPHEQAGEQVDFVDRDMRDATGHLRESQEARARAEAGQEASGAGSPAKGGCKK